MASSSNQNRVLPFPTCQDLHHIRNQATQPAALSRAERSIRTLLKYLREKIDYSPPKKPGYITKNDISHRVMQDFSFDGSITEHGIKIFIGQTVKPAFPQCEDKCPRINKNPHVFTRAFLLNNNPCYLARILSFPLQKRGRFASRAGIFVATSVVINQINKLLYRIYVAFITSLGTNVIHRHISQNMP